MKYIIIILIMMNCLFLSAETYNVLDLINHGLNESLRIQREYINYENTQSGYRSSLIDFLPNASVNTSISNTNLGTNNSANLSISKNLALNEPTYFNLRRSMIDNKNAELQLQEVKKNIAFDILARYISVLESRYRLQSYRESLEIQRSIFQQTQMLHQLNQVSLLDLRQSEITLLDLEISVKNSEDELKRSRRNLFNYLDLEDQGYDFDEIDFDIVEEFIVDQDQVHLDIQRFENEIRKTEFTLTQNRLDFFPSLRVSYNYSLANSYSGNYLSNGLLDFSDYQDGYSVVLSLSYSLFNFWQHGENHSRLRNNYKNQLISFREYENEKRIKIENALMEFETLKELTDLNEQRYQLAVDNKDLAEQRYRLGLISLVDFEQANFNYLKAQIDLRNQYYRLLLKQEELNLLLSNKILNRW